VGSVPALSAIRKLLVANRGEIARRVFRTCEQLGIATAAVYEEADRNAPHVRDAREAVNVSSYLSIHAMVSAAQRVGASAIHPGYGFLAENADFAAACEAAGIVFVGPRADTIRAMGSKIEARKIAEGLCIPVIPSDGYPLIVKAAAGGGGKGMRRVDRAEDLDEAVAAARGEAESAFGDGTLLVERYLEEARHIEVQFFGDGQGNVIDLFERECSLQRRHQKIIEESPAPGIDRQLRNALCDAAVKLGRALNYTGAGTVEFLLASTGEFYFLEVNTRIQVEHPVTEMVTGLDLVRMQIEVAEGQGIALDPVRASGHAIEARLYAEDPSSGFLPSTGTILAWRPPAGVRVESGIETGSVVGIAYDPLLAKIIAYGRDREEAIRKLRHALEETLVHGVVTNREYLIRVLEHPDFSTGRVHTGWSMPFAQDRDAEALHRAALDGYIAARRQAQRKILSSVADGWRNNPWPAPAAAGPRVRIFDCEPRTIRAEFDGVQREYIISEDDRAWWIGHYTFPQVSRYPSSESAASGQTASSPMPGKVLRVLVEAGAAVQAGDALVILEAMKMEQTVRAHASGRVAAVLVKPGDIVAPGQTLIQMGESA
jgi:propionyl-CoA carboxylase alpha chain